MKLLNYTTSYFAAILLLVISAWAAVFYYSMLDEIYDSMDDGLDNQKQLIIRKVTGDSSMLSKPEFGESNYRITPVDKQHANTRKDLYSDTLMYMENEDEYEPVRLLKTTFSTNNRYYELHVITSMVEEDDLVNALITALIWLYLGIVLPIVLLNNLLLKKVWKPFYRLVSQLKHFRVDRYVNISTQKTKVEEFRLLNEALQKMQDNNLQVFASQKHFIENAAHELQTPLAVAINKLEHLSESSPLSGEQLQLLSSALDSLEKLTRFNRSLLLLSKIENRQYPEESAVNIKLVAEKILDDFNDQVSYKQLTITTNMSDCILEMNYDLAVILVTNLVKNAIVHTLPGGNIRLMLDATSLSVSNSGDTALDANTVFSRFNSQNKSSHSNGLGLSIVKAIADLYGFTAAYSYEAQHVITIAFR